MERNYVETHSGAEICANTQWSGNMCKHTVERKYVQTHSFLRVLGDSRILNCAFPHIFRSRKFGEMTVFFVVQ